jgi:PAS domain-containing protein
MNASGEPKRWMRELADVRLQAAKLRSSEASSAALDLARRALDLADTIRVAAATAHQRCLALEADLAANEKRMEAMFDMVPVAVITTNSQGAVLHANAAACALLARGKPTLKRSPLLHFAEDRDAFNGIVQQLTSATGPVAAATRLRPCNRAPVNVNLTIVRDVVDAARWHWFIHPVAPPLLGE